MLSTKLHYTSPSIIYSTMCTNFIISKRIISFYFYTKLLVWYALINSTHLRIRGEVPGLYPVHAYFYHLYVFHSCDLIIVVSHHRPWGPGSRNRCGRRRGWRNFCRRSCICHYCKFLKTNIKFVKLLFLPVNFVKSLQKCHRNNAIVDKKVIYYKESLKKSIIMTIYRQFS